MRDGWLVVELEWENRFVWTLGRRFFTVLGMKTKFRVPDTTQQALLDRLQVRLLRAEELPRCHQLLDQHHYLRSLKPV